MPRATQRRGNGAYDGCSLPLRMVMWCASNVTLADRNGVTPLALARQRGYKEMADILERAGAKP